MTIRKAGNKHVVVSRKGKRLSGLLSEGAARKRLREIEFFKHKGKR